MKNKCEHRIATFWYYGNDYGLLTEKEIIDILKGDIDCEYEKYMSNPNDKDDFDFSQTEFIDCQEMIIYEFIDYCPDCGKKLDCEDNFLKINKFLSNYVNSLPRKTAQQIKELKIKTEELEKQRKIFEEKEYEREHTGFVYLIKLGDSYKIGITKNTKERFKQFEFMPFDLQIIKTAKVKNYENIETLLHDMYKEKRIKGEWFNLTQDDIQNIIDYLSKLEV